MELNGCVSQMQSFLADTPLVVLGSGMSASFGLPTMQALAKEICNHQKEFSGDEAIKDFFANIESGIDLETALGLDAQMDPSDKNLIRKIVWEYINGEDRRYYDRLLQNQFDGFSLVPLFKKLLEPTPHVIDIVTTNYDRLAEYASDFVKANTVTGYEGTYYKTMEFPDSQTVLKRIRARERTINIWKVHGSLDWFLAPSGVQCALPWQEIIPVSFYPNIVPPGHDKYQITHFDPYRIVMQQADNAIDKARCYLILGYGFNDEHIQPKLLAQINKGKPVVILVKKMTDACKKYIVDANVKKYLVFEQIDDAHTKVYGNGWTNEYEGQYWRLDEFIKIW